MNLLECMRNDWELSGKSLLELLPGKVAPRQVALWQSLSRSLKVTFGGSEIALDLKQRLREDPSPMQTITMAYLKLATDAKERRKSGDPWPVIIIDEANALSEWEDKRPLLALLRFFVFLTKQKQLAHGERAGLLVPSRVRVKPHACLAVVLATSDTFLLNWLESGASALPDEVAFWILSLLSLCFAGPIVAPFSNTYTIGNLSRDEARTFFFHHVLSSKEAPGAIEAWDRVYEVCGGNPGALRNCATNALMMDWEEGEPCVATSLNGVSADTYRSL